MKYSVLGPQLRSFSRSFTHKLGLLDSTPYDASLSLFESRIVFELHQAGQCLAKDLCESLSVDKGYLSRSLASLAKRKLIRHRKDERDRRRSWIRLTPKGEQLFAKIDRVSHDRSVAVLKAVGADKAKALIRHLSAAEIALRKAPLELDEVRLRGLEAGDLGWVIGRHGEVYAEEYGWNGEFERLVAEIALGFVQAHDRTRERAWIAEARGVRLGCIFLVREGDQVAKLRILLVDPLARGIGLGSLLVETCISFAKEAGYRRLTLWTNDVLHSARKIYESQGFSLEKAEKHHSFGKALVGQYWARDL